jgi:serine/threonine protein kinase
MQANRWKRVEDLCQAALELAPEKRAAFLAQACADDVELRREVQSLLDQRSDSFLESAPLSVARALSAGAKLGNFEIVELLGRGGMGEVWKARDARLNRIVAIKILPPRLAGSAESRDRFEREARMIASFNHPDICTLHDVGHHGEVDYLVMEFLEGETLAAG